MTGGMNTTATSIEELLDRHAIQQVLLRYARGLDRLDNALALSCYWDDAIEDHGHFVGTPAHFVPWADGTTLMFESTQHAILNHFCDLQGDEAFCETYYHFSGVTAQGPNFMSTGRYVDHFARRQGPNGPEWRIANRVTIVEGTYDVPKSASAPSSTSAYTADEPCQAARDATDVSYHRPPVPRRPKG